MAAPELLEGALSKGALLIRNERIKLFAGFLNALGLGLIGFAVLRPVTETFQLVGIAAAVWGLAGLVLHGAALYILGQLRSDEPPLRP